MMSRAAVHEHRTSHSQEPLIRQRDITELAAIIEDFDADPKSAARAILDAGYHKDDETPPPSIEQAVRALGITLGVEGTLREAV